METVRDIASESAVVIFSKSTCCMCHTIKRFFSEMGVKTVVHEIDEEMNEREIEGALSRLLGRNSKSSVPAVFIGGRLIGSTDKVMSLHLEGRLLPLLRAAGAIWL
ncbi:glutaredoxin-C1-like [Asparagus officinalis]|uniref:glutaredoxin-C1-like n=1 Tax=Asparagus officinalis TaxID=4686 RepID=UPI00098DEDB9|nr:glutaredoxin-C1-like [Asparagus officinalis]